MINLHHIKTLRNSEKRIAELTGQERITLMASIPTMMKMVGCDITANTEPETRDVITQTLESLLMTNYGMNITPGEFKYAFHLYITGDVEVKKEFQHFGQFNLKFIAELLNDYCAKRNAMLKTSPQERIETEKQLPSKHPFDECMENYVFMLDVLMQTGELPKMGEFQYCFLFLEVTGEINPSAEEREDHALTVRQMIKTELSSIDDPARRKAFEQLYDAREAFKIRCQDEYFKMWIRQKITDCVLPDGEIDQGELKQWAKSEIDRVNEMNNSGKYNKFRK